MNTSKKIILLATMPVCLAFSFAVAVEFYTAERIKTLAEKASRQAMYGSGWTKPLDKVTPQPGPLYLGSMLYANIHAQNPGTEDWWGAGSYTPETYKNGWRAALAKNPRLAYMGHQKYGSTFTQELVAALNERREEIITNWKDGAERAAVLNQFDAQKYWQDQREVMERYDGLIDGLLALSDQKLNEFVAEIPNQLWKGQETSELQMWFVDNGYLTKTPQEFKRGDPAHTGAWNYGTYPVDLLFLTHRVSRDFPDWTAREFLKEAKKFGYSVKSKLPR